MQPSPFLFTVQLLDRNQSLPGPFCRYYSLFTLAMLVMFESTVVTQRLRNLKELRSLQNPKQPIMVYRQGKWEKLPGDALLPGDVISIGRPAGGEFAAAIYLHEPNRSRAGYSARTTTEYLRIFQSTPCNRSI